MEPTNSQVQSELQTYQQRRQEIENLLSKRNPVREGAFDLSYYRLREQRKKVQEKISELSGMLTPDIIA